MRELIKSIGRFSWGMSLFGVEQARRLARRPSRQGRREHAGGRRGGGGGTRRCPSRPLPGRWVQQAMTDALFGVSGLGRNAGRKPPPAGPPAPVHPPADAASGRLVAGAWGHLEARASGGNGRLDRRRWRRCRRPPLRRSGVELPGAGGPLSRCRLPAAAAAPAGRRQPAGAATATGRGVPAPIQTTVVERGRVLPTSRAPGPSAPTWPAARRCAGTPAIGALDRAAATRCKLLNLVVGGEAPAADEAMTGGGRGLAEGGGPR